MSDIFDLPVANLNGEMLTNFVDEKLHASVVGNFNPEQVLRTLAAHQNDRVIGLDIGGSHIAMAKFEVRPNGLLPVEQFRSFKSAAGAGYLSVIESVAYSAQADSLSVGISFAGPIVNGEPLMTAKFTELNNDLGAYGGNFQGEKSNQDILFGNTLKTVDNDAIAGLKAAALESKIRYPNIKNIIYLIVGSGFGGAVLRDDEMIAAEVGHVPIVAELNPFNRTENCGVYEIEGTCVSRVASGKFGIEATWQDQTGDSLSAIEIEELALTNNGLAVAIYDNSADVICHTIEGLAWWSGIDLNTADATIVLHGGTFNFTDFANRVKQILSQRGSNSPVLLTKDFSRNACLDGAALAALIA